MSECILLPEQYQLLWKTSWLSLGSSPYLYYRGHPSQAFLAICVFLTSVNYWYKPDYSWRRYLDIAVVCLSLSYQAFVARNAEHRVVYYTINSVAITSFLASRHFYQQKRWWASTLLHANLHLLANVSQCILVTGSVPTES